MKRLDLGPAKAEPLLEFRKVLTVEVSCHKPRASPAVDDLNRELLEKVPCGRFGLRPSGSGRPAVDDRAQDLCRAQVEDGRLCASERVLCGRKM